MAIQKTGFGGSCHWCTEAIFLSLKGVKAVEQGWIASNGNDLSFSEGVIVEYNPAIVSLETLVAIHLYTHSCTAEHRMRQKYRSAVYTFNDTQKAAAEVAIRALQAEFEEPVITMVLPYKRFRINQAQYLNYYYSDPGKPFCENIVNPKLRLLLKQFSSSVDREKLKNLANLPA